MQPLYSSCRWETNVDCTAKHCWISAACRRHTAMDLHTGRPPACGILLTSPLDSSLLADNPLVQKHIKYCKSKKLCRISGCYISNDGKTVFVVEKPPKLVKVKISRISHHNHYRHRHPHQSSSSSISINIIVIILIVIVIIINHCQPHQSSSSIIVIIVIINQHQHHHLNCNRHHHQSLSSSSVSAINHRYHQNCVCCWKTTQISQRV